MTITETKKRIKAQRLIAIVRGVFTPEQYTETVAALVENGIGLVEVTLNSTEPFKAIKQLCGQFPDAQIGAGTVRTVAQAEAAIEAGAQYLISPGLKADVAAYAKSQDMLHLPGVATPTEIEAAIALGCTMVKLFPASHLGGAGYMKAVAAPLDDVAIIPTGGINTENAAAYLEAGAVALGLGSGLVKGDNDYDALARRARQFRQIVEAI